METQEIKALIKLLDEQDEYIIGQVEERLQQYYNMLPVSTWSVYLQDLPDRQKQRLYEILKKFNYDWVLDQMRIWAASPQVLSYGLYLVSRVFSPLLEFPDFAGLLYSFNKSFPDDFKNFPVKDKAVFLVKAFTEWYRGYPNEIFKSDSPAAFDPYAVLMLKEGSVITISLLMCAVMEKYGLHWLVVSDARLRYTYIVVPEQDDDFFVIDTRNSIITQSLPFSRDDIIRELHKGYLKNNLLSMKSLVMGLLQEGIFPENSMQDEWQIINRFNYLLSLHSQ